MPPFPIFIIPYPLPIVPSPGSCPCYLVNPGNNSTNQGQSSNGQAPQGQYQGQSPYAPSNGQAYAPYGIIGFVPVLFVPYCPGSANGMNTAQENFPNAVSVPYTCKQCQQRGVGRDFNSYLGRINNGRSVDFGDLKKISSAAELEHFLKNAVKPSRKGMRRLSAGKASMRSDSNDKNKTKTTA